MKLKGIDHIAVSSENPSALAEWYIDNLGFSMSFAGNAGNYFIKAPDHILLEIMLPSADAAGSGAEASTGWKHIAVVPTDFEDAVRELQSKGIGADSLPSVNADGYCTFFFQDPEGNTVHLAKWKNDRGRF